jgi:hypothetical protein
MQSIAVRRPVLPSIVLGLVPLLSYCLGVFVTYVAWPLAASETLFFDLRASVGAQHVHVVYIAVWAGLALLVAVFGAVLSWRSTRSTSAPVPASALAGVALIEFGIVVGHLWLGGLLVGTTIFFYRRLRGCIPTPESRVFFRRHRLALHPRRGPFASPAKSLNQRKCGSAPRLG